MKLIQCKPGPTSTVVAGQEYVFALDAHNRAVSVVDNLHHRAVLLSVEHYIEVPEELAAVKAAPEPEKPKEPTAAPASAPAAEPNTLPAPPADPASPSEAAPPAGPAPAPAPQALPKRSRGKKSS
tara:strand:+ start:5126 stop:5500 length:375 start_codon:yes stop_codon:yes gene_type:complete